MEREDLKSIFTEVFLSYGFKKVRGRCYKSNIDFLIVAELRKLPYSDSYELLYGFCIRSISECLPYPSSEDCLLSLGGDFRLTKRLSEIPYQNLDEEQFRELLHNDIEKTFLPVEKLGYAFFLQHSEWKNVATQRAYLYMENKIPKPIEIKATMGLKDLQKFLQKVLVDYGFHTISDELWKTKLKGHKREPNLYYLQKGEFIFKIHICKSDLADYYIWLKITDMSLTWPATRNFYPDFMIDDLRFSYFHIIADKKGLSKQELYQTLKNELDSIIFPISLYGRKYLVNCTDLHSVMDGSMLLSYGIA